LQLLLTVVQSHALQSLIDKALVFLSDRQKGLVEAVENVFVGCAHGYCLKHLEANLVKEFKNSKLSEFLWKAASATAQPVFDKALEGMASINPKSVPWLLSHAKPQHWAELCIPGCRYDHLTSNIAESLNSWIVEARKKPILAIFQSICHQLTVWFDVSRTLEDETIGLLVAKPPNTSKSLPTIVHVGTVPKFLSRVSCSKSNHLKLSAITSSSQPCALV
jgi:Transposase, Mutator family